MPTENSKGRPAWLAELEQFQDDINAGKRKPPVRDPIEPATLERSMHFARFVLEHPDMLEVIQRRFNVQEDLKEDRKLLGNMMWYYQIKYNLDNLNTTGLVVVWGILADIFAGKFSGLDDPKLIKSLKHDIELHANHAFRMKAKLSEENGG